MDARELLKGEHLDAATFIGKKLTLTITGFTKKLIENRKGVEEERGILVFKETPLDLILNKTNLKCLIALWGHETDNWNGHRLTLYTVEEAKSESGYAIRIWGSPDLDEDLEFQLKLARKKPKRTILHKVDKRQRDAVPQPPRERDPGEEG